VGDVDSLHVEIDNLNDLLVGFFFIRRIDLVIPKVWASIDIEVRVYSLFQRK
jgi:hypothetical protein